jgi:hypothetical protein
MNINGQRKTILKRKYCKSLIGKLGLKEEMTYELNCDTISKVNCLREKDMAFRDIIIEAANSRDNYVNGRSRWGV